MANTEPLVHRVIAAARKRLAFEHNVLPLLASLLFHAAILMVGLLTYQSVKVLLRHETQTVPGDTPLISPALNLGLDDGFRGDPMHHDSAPTQNEIEAYSVAGWNNRRGSDRGDFARSLADDRESQTPSDTLIGIGLHAGRSGQAGAPGDGGPVAAFGIPQPGGGSKIFGLGPPGARRPRSVVYLCDASGSMLPKFDALKRELSKAIQGLQPVQSFSVHFFTDRRAISLGPQLVMATPENKLRALTFLDHVAPRGSTAPILSLEIAFKQKPQLIFLLTDGDFPDNATVLNRIRQLNHDHRVRIDTIAFVGEGDSDTAFIALLQQIAHENGGTYRHVTHDDLQ